MVDRRQALEDVLGSARLEGAEPGPEMRALLARWADGELSTEQLDELAKRAAAELPLDPPRAA
ncbi:MAG: antitoxin VbhA family protein [Solirubrobacteraceae bacterium]